MISILEPALAEKLEENWHSKAVIANNGGIGCILWYVGESLYQELDAVGGTLADMGLDDAPDGISVWEGAFVWAPGWEYPSDGDSSPSGQFRDPTDEEWAAIRENRNPWEDNANEGG